MCLLYGCYHRSRCAAPQQPKSGCATLKNRSTFHYFRFHWNYSFFAMPAFECSPLFCRHALVLRSAMQASGFSLVRTGPPKMFTWQRKPMRKTPIGRPFKGNKIHLRENVGPTTERLRIVGTPTAPHPWHARADRQTFTRSIGDPLLNPDCVQAYSQGMLCPPTKAPDKCRGQAGSRL